MVSLRVSISVAYCTQKNFRLDFSGSRADPEAVTFAIVAVGLGAGMCFGLFGAGGSAFATPLLALVGVPAHFAVASPLPAMLPASLASARDSMRRGRLDRRLALLSVAGGVPGTVLGAVASSAVRGSTLLVASGVVLLLVAVRVLVPVSADSRARATQRSAQSGVIVVAAAAVGFLSGLLANGGGFLLVPLFIVGFGLSTRTATGTSMLVVGVMTVPALVAHAALGHIDWTIAAAFAAGVLPGAFAGNRIADRLPGTLARNAFGVALLGFGLVFLARQL
jgi:uncharacterized protein